MQGLPVDEEVERRIVIKVEASCDEILKQLASRPPDYFLAGIARIIEAGERHGTYIVRLESKTKDRLEVNISININKNSLIYSFSKDLKGALNISCINRNGYSRIYINAKLAGKVIDEHGKESIDRLLHRIIIYLNSLHNIIVLPEKETRVADTFVEVLDLFRMALAPSIKSQRESIFIINKENGSIVETTNISENVAQNVSGAVKGILEEVEVALRTLKYSKPRRIVISDTEGNIVVIEPIEGYLAVTLLPKAEREEGI